MICSPYSSYSNLVIRYSSKPGVLNASDPPSHGEYCGIGLMEVLFSIPSLLMIDCCNPLELEFNQDYSKKKTYGVFRILPDKKMFSLTSAKSLSTTDNESRKLS